MTPSTWLQSLAAAAAAAAVARSSCTKVNNKMTGQFA
jgi:hypothetical protein